MKDKSTSNDLKSTEEQPPLQEKRSYKEPTRAERIQLKSAVENGDISTVHNQNKMADVSSIYKMLRGAILIRKPMLKGCFNALMPCFHLFGSVFFDVFSMFFSILKGYNEQRFRARPQPLFIVTFSDREKHRKNIKKN